MRFNNLPKQVKQVAAGLTAMAFTGAASAGELSDAVNGGVDKAELIAIGVIVMAVTGIILLIRSGKKSAGG